MPMEELSERARRILGSSCESDGSIQGDLAAALDRIVALETRAIPPVVWNGNSAIAGLLLLTTYSDHRGHHWEISRGNGFDDGIDAGDSVSPEAAKTDCETALLRLVGASVPDLTSAEKVIAHYDALVKRVSVMKRERDSLLRKVAFPWQPDRKGYDRMGVGNAICCSVWPINGQWSWTTDGNRWHPAEPNTAEAAKAGADAQLIADGVFLVPMPDSTGAGQS